MKFADLSPPLSPTLDQQRDALRKGHGRATQWAKAGCLTDEPLLEACLHDKRYDMQCEDNRGEWLWGILRSAGAIERFREEIVKSLRHASTERDAGQLSDLAFRYAKAGDDEFKTQLYEFVERKPVPDCPWIGEGQLLELDGEEAFRFIVRIRGKLLEGREWDWDNSAIVDRAIEKFGEQRVSSLLDDSADSAISRFATAWRNSASPPADSPRQEHVEQMRAISVSQVIESPPPIPVLNPRPRCTPLAADHAGPMPSDRAPGAASCARSLHGPGRYQDTGSGRSWHGRCRSAPCGCSSRLPCGIVLVATAALPGPRR